MQLAQALSRISIRRVTVTLAVVSGMFTILGLVTQIMFPGPSDQYTWIHMFDLDGEATAPAWFQTEMLFVCAVLLWLIGSSRGPRDGRARYWKFLAAVFVYLSADEDATLHETLGVWISKHVGHAMDVYAWLIPGIAFVIYMAIVSWKHLRTLPPAIRNGMLLAAVVYVLGAAGFDVIESQLDKLWGTLRFSMLTVVEETFEMAGLVIFIHVLLSYVKVLADGPTVRVEA